MYMRGLINGYWITMEINEGLDSKANEWINGWMRNKSVFHKSSEWTLFGWDIIATRSYLITSLVNSPECLGDIIARVRPRPKQPCLQERKLFFQTWILSLWLTQTHIENNLLPCLMLLMVILPVNILLFSILLHICLMGIDEALHIYWHWIALCLLVATQVMLTSLSSEEAHAILSGTWRGEI